MNFLKKFFGPTPNKHKTLTNDEIEIIVNAYGRILEAHSPAPGQVADTQELPFPKEKIKAALISAIQFTHDPAAREQLKAAYLMLADWQIGVGNEPKGIDVLNLDMNMDTQALANQILMQGQDFDKWKNIVLKEQQELLNELRTLRL